ncbi:MAG TPA: phospholipase D family protein [Steroidobacteraceae bacterium]|jgi:putative cardiolipin synthase
MLALYRRAARAAALLLAVALVLAGCATLPEHPPRGPPGHALAPQPDGPLADTERALRPKLTRDGDSGYLVLDSNEDGLRWRLALIDSARHSLDVQYYFWWEDECGELVMKHVIEAADRGVKVRVILDDLSTLLEDDRTLKIRDWQIAVLNAHPNIELRLFNAFRARSFAGRAFDFLKRMDLMNQRMHNKLLIADNRAVILGGRNIGNEYFGFAQEFNFRDLDLLGLGAVSRQASNVFDRFWNSEWVVPVSALKLSATPRDLRAQTPMILEKLTGSAVIAKFPLNHADWADRLAELARTAQVGNSHVLTDMPGAGSVRHRMPLAIRELMKSAQKELLIANAYVIPDEEDIAVFKELHARGVQVRILTNSLASQDVPAVNSHYKRWRKPLLGAGVELYESRPDAAVRTTLADTPPNHAHFMGLHVKAIVVDRQSVFVGSMNLDPRSEELNSEMGVVVDSDALAREIAGTIERDMQPENAWQVKKDAGGRLEWVAGSEILTRQPARGTWQRTQDFLFMLFPRNLY